jgi:hypothetical protein
MSLPGLAPIVGVLLLAEIAVGTLVATYAGDLVGDVHRGFLGTTAVICLAVMGADLVMLAFLPDPSELLHQPVDASLFASFVHWCIGFAGAAAAYALFCAVGTDAARRVVGAIAASCGWVALGFAAATFRSPLLGGFGGAVVVIPAALLVGSTVAGMLLGHWYLIAPDLSFRPLRQAVYLIFGTIGIQVGAILAGLLAADAATRTALLAGHYGVSFWLLVVAAGVITTAAVNALTLYYARIRANQPATAMLYILIIAVLMGLVPGHLLYFLTRVPV